MRHLLSVLFFLTIYNLASGQGGKKFLESSSYKRVYQISNEHQIINLIQVNDTIYIGELQNFVTKITRKGKKNQTILEELTIPDFTVKKMIEKLSNENIELLPDSRKVEDYVNGLDGTTISIGIYSSKRNEIITYWEPENNYYQNPELPEVKNVRNILKAIKNEIDIEKLFSNFTNGLGPGSYNLGGVILTKK